MNISTVNELIASLESAGELSIRETKVMALAKAYQQLAAENVALKQFPEQIVQYISGLGTSEIGIETKEKIGLAAIRIKTPATDRIVAGIKAEGVEEFAAYQRAITEEWACKEGHSSLPKVAESAELFAKQLREGADKC
ncbi:hypothetical protein [Klebsiella pneumoniae]|uniref:hypothetical protein n=1 Tax=Klebsiella pneumoniae TaxID=573 RepID=UPI0012959BA0|nr:hypothetical protein [Klebsiella pneumoniae]QGA03413.1 hypothetical protein GFJ44_14280 [Klebsiella pneumoniae]